MDKRSENGNITYTAGGAIAKGEFVKFSSGKVVKCAAATDVAIGVALDGAAEGAIVPVAILGAFTGTVQIKAAGAVTQGGEVTPEGKEQTAAGTTELICGRALEAAAAAGDMIEIAHAVCHAK